MEQKFITILTIIGLPTILGSVIPFLVTRWCNKKDKREFNKDSIGIKLNQMYKEYEETYKDYRANVSNINNEIKDIKDILSILESSNQAILRDRIVQMYNHYYVEKKYMPIYARESLDHMYTEYRGLNGNGVVPPLVEKLYSLPTEPQYIDQEEE